MLRKLLVSRNEVLTDHALNQAVGPKGYRVCPKVRLADVFDLDAAGVSAADLSYGLRAHFDFVITKGDDAQPQFAVEFDGSQHQTDPTTRSRDERKNRLSRRFGLPLLRIDAQWLRRGRRYTVLGWLIEVTEYYEAWSAAQERGEISLDEPFSWYFVMDAPPVGDPMKWEFIYDLSAPARQLLAAAHVEGWTRAPGTQMLRVHDDGDGYAVAHAILPLALEAGGGFIVGSGRTWSFSFPGVSPSEVAQEIAEMMAAEHLEEFWRGDYAPWTGEEVSQLRSERDWTADGWAAAASAT